MSYVSVYILIWTNINNYSSRKYTISHNQKFKYYDENVNFIVYFQGSNCLLKWCTSI